MRVTRAGLAMVMSLSWMAHARTSSVIVRNPVRIRNGLTSRSVGSNNMFPVLCLRTGVARCFPTCVLGFFSFWYGVGGERWFLVFLASPWCLVHLGGASFACHSPCVYKAWVSKMCLLLDTPCGRRSVGALSSLPLGSLLGSMKNCLLKLWLDL